MGEQVPFPSPTPSPESRLGLKSEQNGHGFVPQVTPQPLPFQYVLTQVQMSDGSMMVALQVFTPLGGPLMFFMPPDFARALADKLTETATATGSGLVLPPS